MFKEVENDEQMSVKKVDMNTDMVFRDKKGRKVAYPLPQTSFAMQINGYSGSGKSTLLLNLLTRKQVTPKGHKMSYRNIFDRIIFVSPSAHTLPEKSPLTKLQHRFKFFNEDVLDLVDDMIEDNMNDDNKERYLLVMDDVSNQIRKNRPLENRLVSLLQNRRHVNFSVVMVTQRSYDLPPTIRSNLNYFFTFKPKTMREENNILDEYLPLNSKISRKLLNFIFDAKHNFMLIDMSLTHSSKFEVFKNFNLVEIRDEKISPNYIDGEKNEKEVQKSNIETEAKSKTEC